MSGNTNEIDSALKIIEPLAKLIAKPTSTIYKNTIPQIKIGYSKYVASCRDRFGKVKTLLYRHSPQPIDDFYVPAKFSLDDKIYTDTDILTRLPSVEPIVVTGMGGSGKTIFLRKLFLGLLDRGEKIPLFLELRVLNNRVDRNLVSYLYDSISPYITNFSFENFQDALRAGVFTIILDAFDEVDFDIRDHTQASIVDFRNKYPKSHLVISSRPNEKFDSWADFSIFSIKKLSKDDVRLLVSKLKYDESTKKTFIDEIERNLWNTHSDFLSNPLLTTIMLMTFADFAKIPDKKHIFYNQAFETLYIKHDALKQLYTRKTYSQLPIDEFKSVVSALAVFSYVDARYEFSREELNQYIDNSLGYSGVNASQEDIICDLLESTCLLVQEGTDYRFVHRSFQEYFTALFLNHSDAVTARKVISVIGARSAYDETFRLCYSMDELRFENDWVKPVLKDAIAAYQYVEINDLFEHIKYNSINITIVCDVKRIFILFNFGAAGSELEAIPHILQPLFGSLFGSFEKNTPTSIISNKNTIDKMISGALDVNAKLRKTLKIAKETMLEKNKNKLFSFTTVANEIKLLKKDVSWLQKTEWWAVEKARLKYYKRIYGEVSERLDNRSAKLSEILFD